MNPLTSDRPRRADAERNRARILQTASELFADRGLDASMPELAERAGVGVGTLYRAFPDKDHLLGAVVAQRYQWFAEQVETAAEAGDAWTAFSEVVCLGAALHVKDRAFQQCVRRVMTVAEVREARERTLAAMQRLIERAQAQGAMRADVTAEDVPMLLSGIGASRDAVPGLAWERHLAIVLDGLRAEGARTLPCTPARGAQLDAVSSRPG
jgi:AcrR family transcriptional regulator